MNTTPGRKRLLWLAAIGAGLLLVLFAASLAMPSSSTPATSAPVIRTADDAAEVPGDSARGFSLTGGDAVSLAWRAGLVVVILAGSIAGLRWWAKRASAPRSTSGFLKVVDTLAIGSGRTVHLVALGERVIVVGATTQNLSLLGELTDHEAAGLREAIPTSGQGTLSGFAGELIESLRRERTSRPQQARAAFKRGDGL